MICSIIFSDSSFLLPCFSFPETRKLSGKETGDMFWIFFKHTRAETPAAQRCSDGFLFIWSNNRNTFASFWCKDFIAVWSTLQKRNFPLRISSVNVTKSAGNYGFSHIYWRNSPWKISFFAVLDSLSLMWVFGLFQFSKRSDGDSPFQFFTYFFWDAKIPRCNLQA